MVSYRGGAYFYSGSELAMTLSRFGLLTSGGDAPGMNSAIRAVVRTASTHGLEVMGIRCGYQGLVDDNLFPMDRSSVSGIIVRGGTVLKTARCKEFHTPEGRERAYATMRKHDLGGLIVIGGDGSFRGGLDIVRETDFQVIGIPGSIDNDIAGSDYSIGFDTAVMNALLDIDKVRDTAESHGRIFVVEVMGRECGFLAAHVAVAAGAEDVLIPEIKLDLDQVVVRLKRGLERGKQSYIIVVAEGAARSYDVASFITEQTGRETRVVVLGHVQRGGSPTATDRLKASRMGELAVEALLAGQSGKMIASDGDRLVLKPLSGNAETDLALFQELVKLVETLGG